MDTQNKRKNVFTQWLETLQQESWQLELLISGFAVFGVWEARKVVANFEMSLLGANAYDGIAGQALALLVLIAKSGLLIVLVNFLIHVTLRALWIGAIGLRYVSGDIDYEKLEYSSTFIKHYRKSIGTFDDYIESLENWCSVIFAYTFLLVGIFTSFMLYVLWFVLGAGLIQSTLPLDVAVGGIAIFSIIYVGLGFLVFFDFITMGLFRKVEDKTFSLVYLRLYQIFGLITFSFVYRPLLLNFLDTRFTRRLFLFSLPYIAFILLVFPPLSVVTYGYYPSNTQEFGLSITNYDDLRNEALSASLDEQPERRRIRYFSLEKHIVDEGYGKVFFNSHENDDNYYEHMVKIQALRETGLRHEIFMSTSIPDSTHQKAIDGIEENISQLRRQRRVMMRESDGSTSSNSVADKYKGQIDSLTFLVDSLRENRTNKRYSRLLHGFQDLVRITIDSIDFTDSLSCRYYTHPNLGEQGILCVYPTRSIPDGEHMMLIERDLYDLSEPESLATRSWLVPFWKYTGN